MKFFNRVAVTLACLFGMATTAQAALEDGHFSTNQIFDVQYSWSGSTLNASNFIAPYDMNFQHPTVASGDYFAFFPSTTNSGTYGMGLYDSTGALKQVVHDTGTLQAIGPDAIFYVGSGFFGTVITTSAGYAYGSSGTFTSMDTDITTGDITSYTWASTTPLAAGETASSSGSGSGSGSTAGTPAAGGLMTYIGGGTSTVNFPTPVATIDATGNYVRFGMNSLGTIGSGGNTSPGLLFDSTGTGTFNTSYDYLTPGSPFDGFTVKALNSDGTTHFEYANNNQDAGCCGGGSNNITGYLYDFSGVAYRGNTYDHRGVWIGEVPEFKIENDTYMNNSWMWINIDTRIEAKVAVDTLYFGRYIDPDAVAAAGDSSQTDNALGYGVIPQTNVVFSEAQSSKYALGMYTAQVGNVGAGISSGWTTDPVNYFNGVNDGSGDYTIGLGFKVNGLAVGDIVNFSYAYIFGPSAFAAGETAIDGGAAGGTPGVAGGCVGSSCTLVDVGTASGGSTGGGGAATIDHINTTYERVSGTAVVDTSLPVITASVTTHSASETDSVQTIARNSNINTTTAMRTPVAVTRVDTDVYTDGSTVERRTAQPTEYTLFNDVQTSTASDSLSGRIDQHTVMAGANTNINRIMNHSMLRQDGIKYEHGTLYLNGGAIDSNSGGYNLSTRQYGVAVDRQVRGNWTVGAQFNYVNSTMTGVDSTGSMNKSHFGLYSLYRGENTILQTDLGFANNGYNVNRTIENEFNNASKTSGNDVWLSNRLYNTTKDNVRPFIGVTVGRSTVDGYTETGSIQSARTVAGTSSNMNYAEAGVQFNKPVGKVNLFGELSATTDGFTTAAAGAGYAVRENGILTATVSTHSKDGVTSNRITGGVKFRW
jgi:hypothetical protein